MVPSPRSSSKSEYDLYSKYITVAELNKLAEDQFNSAGIFPKYNNLYMDNTFT
jgi:hypothetical protein